MAKKETSNTGKKTSGKVGHPAAKPAATVRRARRASPPREEAVLERTGLLEMAGKPATVLGADVEVGHKAPHFTAQVGSWPGLETWSEIDPLDALVDKVKIVAAVPSLDTSVCDMEARRFNEDAASLGDKVRIIVISADLPIAQKRWCAGAGVDRLVIVSDHMTGQFGVRYGTLVKERRWLRRAVFIIDERNVIRYAAYMPKLGDQPDYEAVLVEAAKLVAG
jgi:thioredoxin-dependent peroxiredoxin